MTFTLDALRAMTPREVLRNGCKILDPLMEPNGFSFIETGSGKSNYGDFASGEYARADRRRLELHFRHSLGLVIYHIGSLSASHESYMRELLGSKGGNEYPGFSDDPLDAFRHLAGDLKNFGQEFLSGNGEVLVKAASNEAAEREIQQKKDMASWVGDTKKREEARRLFRENNFQAVIEQLESLSYPELMTEVEKKMLGVSKRKLATLPRDV